MGLCVFFMSAFVHSCSVWFLLCAMVTPVTCYLSREIHTEKGDSQIVCGCQSVCMCVHVCIFIAGRQYLWDRTSSGSSVNNMASRHTEIQSAGGYDYIIYFFFHSFNYFSYYCSSFILLFYLSMLSRCELSVALLTLQTQRVVVPP